MSCPDCDKNREIISKIILFVQHNLVCDKMVKIQKFLNGLDLEDEKEKDQLEFKEE